MLLRFPTAPDSERKVQLETSCSIYLTTLNATSHPVLYTEIEPLVPSLYIAPSVLRQDHYPQVDAWYTILDILSVTNIFVGFMSLMVDDGAGEGFAGNVSNGF